MVSGMETAVIAKCDRLQCGHPILELLIAVRIKRDLTISFHNLNDICRRRLLCYLHTILKCEDSWILIVFVLANLQACNAMTTGFK